MSQSTKTSIAYGFNIATKEEGSRFTTAVTAQLEKQDIKVEGSNATTSEINAFLNTLIAADYPSLSFEMNHSNDGKDPVWTIFVARTQDVAGDKDTNRHIEPTKEEIVELEQFKEHFRIAKGSDYLEWKEAESLVDA